MASPKTLLLFRHGETDYNAANRFQGHLDIPLNARGREQARALVPGLRGWGIELVLSSDLERARETGRIVAEALAVPLVLDSRLREAHLGEAQGLTRAEIESRFGAALVDQWRSSATTDADVSFPGGESVGDVMRRAFAALDDLVAGHEAECIGVATHGGVIRRIVGSLLPAGAPPVPIPNGVVYAIEWDSIRWRIAAGQRVASAP